MEDTKYTFEYSVDIINTETGETVISTDFETQEEAELFYDKIIIYSPEYQVQLLMRRYKKQFSMADGKHIWQYVNTEVLNLKDKNIKTQKKDV
jgi:hypothetical protein